MLPQTSGVYILTLDPTRHGVVDAERAARSNAHRIPRAAIEAGLSCPNIGVASMPYYSDRRLLAKVTCVQMTATKLFLVWDAAQTPEHAEGADAGSVPGPSTGPGTHERAVAVNMVVEAEADAEVEGEVEEAAEEDAAATVEPPTGDDVWDAPGIDESQVVTAGEPVAGPSTSAAVNDEAAQVDEVPSNGDDEDNWVDANEEEDDLDDEDGIDDPVVPLLPTARHERE